MPKAPIAAKLVQLGESDLSFRRPTFSSGWVRLTYRAVSVLRRLLGSERTLMMLLNSERLAWRLAYEEAGRVYGEQFHNVHLALTSEQLDEWLPQQANVLDIGCGSGRTLSMIAGSIRCGLGVDLDTQSIALAAARSELENVSFEVGDAQDLPPGEFDVALLVHVLEHVDNAEALLRAIRTRARWIIVEVPAFDHDLLNFVRRDLGLEFSSDGDHLREYTPTLLAAQLTNSGWQIVDQVRSSVSIAVLAESAV